VYVGNLIGNGSVLLYD